MNKILIILAIFCVALNAEALKAICDRDDARNVVVCEEKKLGKLMWQDEESVFKGKQDEAKRYCENLKFAGYDDWRLPSRLELLSITDDSKYDPAANNFFKNVSSNYYWSSTMDANDSSTAWFVFFGNASGTYSSVHRPSLARCVRSY